MHHQNNIEYLQKELDFLKLLITRFREREKIAGLELDIALLKTQEIYEHLLKLRLTSAVEPHKAEDSVPEIVKEKPVAEEKPKQTASAKKKDHSVSEPEPPEIRETKIPEPIDEEVKKQSVPVAEEEKSKPVKTEPKPKKTDPEILAEKIRPAAYQPINETLAQQKTTIDLAGKMQTAPLESIASGIGLNDRFLYIRELFRGDSGLYNDTVRQLDSATSLNDAMDFIGRHFDWDKKNDATKKFIHLIHRRHPGE